MDYKNQGRRYLGMSTDEKPVDTSIPANSLFEEMDTGAIYKFNGVDEWVYYDSAKKLDHNRSMLGLSLSYKVWHEVTVASTDHAVYRFNPGNINFHHAEQRIVRLKNGSMNFKIYRGHDIGNLPAVVTTLEKYNQKGLDPLLSNSELIYTYHGNVEDASLATIISGGELVDADKFFIASGAGQTSNTDTSALPSGRHYDPNTEYLLIIDPGDGDSIDVFYTYFWHEG